MMLAMNWRLALVAFSVLPLIVVLTQWFRRNVRESYRVVRGWIARINAFLQENITGMSTVQLFRREALNFRPLRRDRPAAPRRQHRVDLLLRGVLPGDRGPWPRSRPRSSSGTAAAACSAATLTLGVLVAFLQYSQRFFRPISDMSEKFNILQAAMASSERIFQLLDTEAQVVSPAAPKRLGRVEGRVAFEGVSFSYQAGELRRPLRTPAPRAGVNPSLGAASGSSASVPIPAPSAVAASVSASASASPSYVLEDIDFAVEPGRSVALVGATGAGKTSIISLLMRFYDVQKGRVTLDGTDIRDLDLLELRRTLALVLQDVHLFSGTIASNIRLGSSISDERIHEAARAVHAHRFIEALPKGYDTEVKERGSTLSVGQKQLLSFARALAHDPRVLILDEATSSVDTETEQLIQEALRTLLRGRTAIVIAHRLSTIQNVDEILVLHKGRIRERGTHQQLLLLRGLYWRLYQLQYKEQEVPQPGGAEATATA